MRAVICLSTQFWSDLHTNKQHLMSRLANRDIHVLYVEPASHDAPVDRTLANTPLRLLFPTPSIRKVKPNLWVYSPALLPMRRFALTRAFNRRQEDHILPRMLSRWTDRNGWFNPLLWFYRPEAISILPAFSGSPVLYDCVDDLAAFPSYHRAEPLTLLVGREAKLVSVADVVVVTAPHLQQIFSKRARKLAHIGNVADYDHFTNPELTAKIHPLWQGATGKRIIFVGALNPLKVDVTVLYDLAQKLNKDTLILAGPICGDASVWDILQKLPNVKLPGSIPYRELPSLLAGADVALIPYGRNPYTTSCFPIKFYEYLAAGLPVVSSLLPSLVACEDADLVYFYGDARDIAAAVETAFGQKQSGREKRKERAGKNTWEDRLNRILQELAAAGVEVG